jgi:hypothetical protein
MTPRRLLIVCNRAWYNSNGEIPQPEKRVKSKHSYKVVDKHIARWENSWYNLLRWRENIPPRVSGVPALLAGESDFGVKEVKFYGDEL